MTKDVKKELSQKEIIRALNTLGISKNFVAHGYLRTAIYVCLQNSKYLERIKTDLYFVVALKHEIAQEKMERSIKNAISSVARKYAENEDWKQMFPYGKPSDVQFITAVVKKLQES